VDAQIDQNSRRECQAYPVVSILLVQEDSNVFKLAGLAVVLKVADTESKIGNVAPRSKSCLVKASQCSMWRCIMRMSILVIIWHLR
jgi:hypothetical protein